MTRNTVGDGGARVIVDGSPRNSTTFALADDPLPERRFHRIEGLP